MEIYDGNMESNSELRSVSLAAPLCLLAVAWVARSSKKPLKRPAAKLHGEGWKGPLQLVS